MVSLRPVQGRQIHVTAGSGKPENVTMIAFSSGRHVRVDVPLKLFGKEVSPGIKAGGRVNWIRRTVPCMVSGTDQIPECFEVDIRYVYVEIEHNITILLACLYVYVEIIIIINMHMQPARCER